MEFTPGDLDARGTMHKLTDLIARSPYKRYFDLDGEGSDSFPVANLKHLAAELLERGAFTDLLFIPGRDEFL
jgi:hypothetical protein